MRIGRPGLRHPLVVGVTVVITAGALLAGTPLWRVAVAAVLTYGTLRIGVAVFAGLARPLPEPPPEGEMRKVKLTYRCDVCGAQVRMVSAPSEEPEAPRHCLDDMRLVTPVD